MKLNANQILSKAQREEEVDMRMSKHEMRCLGRALLVKSHSPSAMVVGGG